MPVTLTYPGVYVEEIPSGVHTITGVSTSVTAFIGYTKRGVINKAQDVLSFADFDRMYGGLSRDSPVSYAVHQFFLNGGQRAIVVRIAQAGSALPAKITLMNQGTSPIAVLDVSAKEPGTWANGLVITIDYATDEPDSTFNMYITDPSSGKSESFLNMNMNPNSRRYIVNVLGAINGTSRLISVSLNSAAVVSATSRGTSTSAPGVDVSKIDKDHRQFMITLNEDDGPQLVTIYDGVDANKPSETNLPGIIEAAVKQLGSTDAYQGFNVPPIPSVDPDKKTLTLVSGETGAGSFVRVSNAGALDAAHILGLGAANGGKETDAAASIRPAPNGTTSGSLDQFTSFTGDRKISVTIDGDGPHEITLFKNGVDPSPPPQNSSLRSKQEWLRQLLQSRIQAIKPNQQGSLSFMGVTLQIVGSTIQILSGSKDPNSIVKIDNASSGTDADDLMLSPSKSTQNVKAYTLGTGSSLGNQSNAIPGSDGSPPGVTDYQGSETDKTGINTLLDADIFNILCLPELTNFSKDDATTVLASAVSFCEEHRAFLIIDPPESWLDLSTVLQNLSDFDPVRSKNSAMYFPSIQMADPLNDNRLRTFPPCGAIAGIYARTDSNRGVWKAPAGQDATLTGVISLVYRLTDKENGLLNPLGLNCLRTFPVVGSVCWGARTLKGADVLTSEWKYIPVRRTALFLEESLYRGLKWVVFEPNDEPLWAQIRLNVGAFMQNLFRQGAFQGKTPREAYFVKCDSETTTQDDINRGVVNIVVGFAPLKPAEFVVIKIQQIAGQIQT